MYLPQLLVPYKSKDSFVMPEKHELWMNHFLSDIDEIIVIGWKGTEAKFQDLLKRKLEHKKVTITTITHGDDSAREEFKHSIPNAEYKDAATDFSDYIKNAISENKSLFSS
jgi:rRNA pseudouridine-1189 N-methylase Emg1 (Nep1/Mra1 family)